MKFGLRLLCFIAKTRKVPISQLTRSWIEQIAKAFTHHLGPGCMFMSFSIASPTGHPTPADTGSYLKLRRDGVGFFAEAIPITRIEKGQR